MGSADCAALDDSEAPRRLQLKSRWEYANAPQRFGLQRVPAASNRRCLSAAPSPPYHSAVLGAPVDLNDCVAPRQALTGHANGTTQFLLQDPSAHWLGLGANTSRLHLVTPDSAAPFAAHCIMCPGAPLSAVQWTVCALVLVLMAGLPPGIAMAHSWFYRSRTRLAANQPDDEHSPWPTRSRLWGVPGALIEFGWLMVIAGLVPLGLWLFADAWPGHGGWYLALMPPGAMLMLLVFRPTDPPGCAPHLAADPIADHHPPTGR